MKILRLLLCSFFCLHPLDLAQSKSSTEEPILKTNEDSVDPILREEELLNLPFVKPSMTLQKALKIAEASLRKEQIDRKHYFLAEAKMIDPTKEPAFNWYFKWIRWGVKQRDNSPIEVTVSHEGRVSRLR